MFSRPFIAALAFAALGQAPAPSDADWEWLNNHRDEAFDRLIPIRSAPGQFVAYRSYRDLYVDEPELHFSLRFVGGPPLRLRTVVATTALPIGRSVQQQLLELHMREREASLDTLLPRISIRRETLTESQCPVLKSRVVALTRTSIAIPKQIVIRLHPFQHRLVIDLQGVRIDATLDDPESAIVRWAVATSNALRKWLAS